nr:loricrin-like [Coffea arabica]
MKMVRFLKAWLNGCGSFSNCVALSTGGYGGLLVLCMLVITSLVAVTVIIFGCGDHQDKKSAKKKQTRTSSTSTSRSCGYGAGVRAGQAKESAKKVQCRTNSTSSSDDYFLYYGADAALSTSACDGHGGGGCGGGSHDGHGGGCGGHGGGCGGDGRDGGGCGGGGCGVNS